MNWYPHRRNEPKKLNPIRLLIFKFVGGVLVGLGIDVYLVFGILRSWAYYPTTSDAPVGLLLLFVLIPIISGILFVLFFEKIMKLDKL